MLFYPRDAKQRANELTSKKNDPNASAAPRDRTREPSTSASPVQRSN
jgi:hypothetical protein